MEEQRDMLGILDKIIQPSFCVKENKIIKVNQAAQGLFFSCGQDILPLILAGSEEYSKLECNACLCLTLENPGGSCNASVTRIDGLDVFILDPLNSRQELNILALDARELRKPLANMMVSTEQLLKQEDLRDRSCTLELNQGLYQLLRIIGNMSDAGYYGTASCQEIRNISKVMDEILNKAQTMLAYAGIRLEYRGLEETIYCLADADQLERAVLNLLSNAAKFSPVGSTILASFTRSGRLLKFSITDSGSGIAQSILQNLFYRYLRQPGLEDPKTGIGLGMVLIQSVASCHGDTVLVDQPEGKGSRITMTLRIRQNEDTTLHSPGIRMDYAGGWDHTLLELAEILPSSLYDTAE